MPDPHPQHIPASFVKQNFGQVLAMAALGPVSIERHKVVVAALVPPHWLARADAVDERKLARARQAGVEQARLMRHQQLAIELLCADAPTRLARTSAACDVVKRWQSEGLASADYVQRWREWLELPTTDLAKLMCSDAQGWGAAMRQNSPFSAVEFA